MRIFRKSTIFHAEENAPDPEDLRLRFRRRVLLTAAIGFLLVLGFPVLRDQKKSLLLRSEARHLAERLLDTRLLAVRHRHPISLGIKNDRWVRTFHLEGNDCEQTSMGPEERWEGKEVQWHFRLQAESGESFDGKQLCLHPLFGLLLDQTPVAEGKLLATGNFSDATPSIRLLFSHFGADIQILSH